jgi:hypothetical protein
VHVNLADKPGGHLDEGAVRAVRKITIGGGGIQFTVNTVRHPGRAIGQLGHGRAHRGLAERAGESGARESRENGDPDEKRMFLSHVQYPPGFK